MSRIYTTIRFYIIISIWLVFSTSDEDVACPDKIYPDVVMNPDSKRFYFIQLFSKIKFYRALQYCNYLGMQLLTLQNENEEKFIIKLIQKLGIHENVWSSLTDLQSNGNFIFMTTGRMVPKDSQLWGSEIGEDNNKTCTVLNSKSNWKHYPTNCHEKAYVICENLEK